MKKIKIPALIAAVSVMGLGLAACSGDLRETKESTSKETEYSETSETLVSTTDLETAFTVPTEQTDPGEAQSDEYIRYLKDLYNSADEYAKGYPQKLAGINDGYTSTTTYLKYAIADFNGDDKLELVTVESNNFPVESEKTSENIDKGYLTFRMYRTNDGGGIVENDKINGLSNGISFAEYEKNIKCFNNGVIEIDQTDAVNAAWGYDHQEVKAFLYYNNEVVKNLGVAAMNEYLEGDWSGNNSSYVLMRVNNRRYEICLGGAQDNYTEMTQLTKEQYDSMIKTLTNAREIDVEFKDINKENIGI